MLWKSSARKVTHLSTIQAFRRLNLGVSMRSGFRPWGFKQPLFEHPLLSRQGSLFLCCGAFALIRGVGVQEAGTSGISIRLRSAGW